MIIPIIINYSIPSSPLPPTAILLETDSSDTYEVCGRGQLHLTVLIENMRREGRMMVMMMVVMRMMMMMVIMRRMMMMMRMIMRMRMIVMMMIMVVMYLI